MTLEKISKALDVPITGFFEEASEEKKLKNIIVRKEERPTITVPGFMAKYYVLTPKLNKETEFLIVEYPPFSEDNKERHAFKHDQGEEYFFVLEGEFIFIFEDETYTIYEGDSGCFDSNKKHSYINNTSKPARVLLACTKK